MHGAGPFQGSVRLGGGEQEMESEATGIMIDPKGVVIVSNTQLNGVAGFMTRMMRARGALRKELA